MPTRDPLWTLLVERALSVGPARTLSTGQVSKFYFDCKPVTLSSDGARLVGHAFLEKVRLLPQPITVVGGRTVGADPIIGAMMILASEHGLRLEGFYVRQKAKEHGTMQLIENTPPPGSRVVIVDDVVTTGGSVIEAIEAAQAANCEVVGVITLVDRLAGGAERIKALVPQYYALYTRDDFPQIEAGECTTTSERQSVGAST